MNNEKQKPALSGVERIVPELRFPEFINDGDWEVKKLENICDVNPTNKELPEKFIYVDLESVEKGRLLKRSLIKLKDAPSRAQRLLKKDDVIYQMVRPYQKNNFFFDIDDKFEYVASTGYALLRAFKSKMFLYQYLHTTNFINRVLAKCTGSNYPAINSKDLSRIKVIVPKNPKEQQKIANCLSSLDEVITAETEKRDLLKDHKKGLLQQLFPAEGVALSEAEGRNQPKFRFPEFKSDGDWEEKMISELANRFDNLRKPITASDRIEGTTPYYGANGIQSYIEGYTHNGEFILVAEDGANDLKNYPVQYASGKIWVNNHAHVLQGKIDICNNLFLMYAIQNANIEPYLVGGGRAKLNANIMMKINFLVPELLEQQKIADCLSTVDDLIAAQEQRIEKLQAHKKGLMQQLFPKIER